MALVLGLFQGSRESFDPKAAERLSWDMRRALRGALHSWLPERQVIAMGWIMHSPDEGQTRRARDSYSKALSNTCVRGERSPIANGQGILGGTDGQDH